MSSVGVGRGLHPDGWIRKASLRWVIPNMPKGRVGFLQVQEEYKNVSIPHIGHNVLKGLRQMLWVFWLQHIVQMYERKRKWSKEDIYGGFEKDLDYQEFHILLVGFWASGLRSRQVLLWVLHDWSLVLCVHVCVFIYLNRYLVGKKPVQFFP